MAYGINAPFGFKPVSTITGGTWSGKTNKYRIRANDTGLITYNESIFIGDLVRWNPAAANQGGGSIANIVPNDGNERSPILGVFMGCDYTDTTGQRHLSQYWPASTLVLANSEITAYVIDDPNVVYEAQVSSSTNGANAAKFLRSFIGQNFSVGIGGGRQNAVQGGNTKTGVSAAYVDLVAAANPVNHTDADITVKAIGYSLNPNNLNLNRGYTTATTSDYINILVTLNNHVFKAGTIGIVAA